MISRATLEKVEFLCTKVRNNDFFILIDNAMKFYGDMDQAKGCTETKNY